MDPSFLVNHLENSIIHAFYNRSNVSSEVLAIDGMSGNKTRHLYNNICNLPNVTYLEVGTWKGSSFISALYKNTDLSGICVDNWSDFGGPKLDFYKNLCTHITNNKFKVIDKDCWKVTKDDIGPSSIDIYLYDGAHTYEDQKKAITYYHQFFSKYVIIMVDDWWCEMMDAKKGTLDGLTEMNMKRHFQYEIPMVNSSTYHQGGDTFWNGCGVFLCERTDI
jgi:hypothetical protein